MSRLVKLGVNAGDWRVKVKIFNEATGCGCLGGKNQNGQPLFKLAGNQNDRCVGGIMPEAGLRNSTSTSHVGWCRETVVNMKDAQNNLMDGHVPSENKNERKLMVLAVGLEGDEVVITPLDVEHEDDDQSALSSAEQKERTQMKVEFAAYQPDMQRGLRALHKMFSGRLYRESFRTFENFCFALHGMKRLNDVALLKAREKALHRIKVAHQEVAI